MNIKINSSKSFAQVLDILSNCKQNLCIRFCLQLDKMSRTCAKDLLELIYFAWLETLILSYLKYFEIMLCRHDQKEVVSFHYMKINAGEVLKNDVVYTETSGMNSVDQLYSKSLILQRDFHLKYPWYFALACCLIFTPLYTPL